MMSQYGDAMTSSEGWRSAVGVRGTTYGTSGACLGTLEGPEGDESGMGV